MKIAKADVFVVSGQYILIRLVSADGVVGWGEAHPSGGSATVRAAVELAGQLVRGGEVSIEGLLQKAMVQVRRTGFSAPYLCAVSGIDIALHDLLGHVLGVPVWTLLGGKVRDRVPVYTSFARHTEDGWSFPDEIARYLDRGVRAVKLHTGNARAQDDRPEDTVETVRLLREVWPSRDELGIMVDVNSAFTTHGAVQVGRQLEELDVWWFEEPVAVWDRAAFRRVHDTVRVPIAAGENEYVLDAFCALITDAQVDILQPNVLRVGGLNNAMKIAALAEAFNRPIACNNWCDNTSTTLMTAAQIHFWAAARMCTLPQEMKEDQPGGVGPALLEGIEFRDGHFVVPCAPGLGVTLDVARIEAEGELPFQ